MKKIFIYLIIGLVIGGYLIKTNLETDFSETDERNTFIKEFGKWVFQIGKSTKNTVGYAGSQDWAPQVNESNSSFE